MKPLGSPPVLDLRRVPVTIFRVSFEHDGIGLDFDAEGTPTQVRRRKRLAKTFFSEAAAYRWLARRLVFRRRDKFATSPWTTENRSPGCSLCDAEPRRFQEEPPMCRYHDGHEFERLVTRLARWLRWRDRRSAA